MSKEENAVYIGRKRIVDYCLVVVTIFNKGGNKCTIRARGRSISTAVDVAEITKRKYLPMVEVSDVKIGSEVLESDMGPKTVSTIDITLVRKSGK